MSDTDITPFYLISDNDNIITKSEISEFRSNNLDISHHIDTNNIELKPLEIENFEALCCWIIGQLISSKVARAITKRFRTQIKEISPEFILAMSSEELLNIGLSKSKVKYVKNLASFIISNEMPDFNKLSNKEIIKFFSQVKGVGEWTVQMHLIFAFGRKDVLAAKDLVVRKGVQKLYDLTTVPTVKEVYTICQNWGNLATIGTILSWSVMGE
ncbi:MAG: DNA-3-methyladenine glycosylase 2 family protein [Candidatus Heimdallarchaeota archaeon]|nr:DNA-3-methyladenine glycosylase 2 family protein [Candidatus Heimdallarchaeota archaeon]